MPRRWLEIVKPVLEVGNEWHYSSLSWRKRNALGQNAIVHAKADGWWRNVALDDFGDGSLLSLHGFEVCLAHLVKVSLRLFGAARNLAGLGFGTVSLAEALRLDDSLTAFHATESSLVLEDYCSAAHRVGDLVVSGGWLDFGSSRGHCGCSFDF